MDTCVCGRPLWDGMRVCETCLDDTRKQTRNYKRRVKYSLDQVSGYERCAIRTKLARQGRGYEA